MINTKKYSHLTIPGFILEIQRKPIFFKDEKSYPGFFLKEYPDQKIELVKFINNGFKVVRDITNEYPLDKKTKRYRTKKEIKEWEKLWEN